MKTNLRLITNDRLIDWQKIDNLPEDTIKELDKKQYKFIPWENVRIDDTDNENPILNVHIGQSFDYLWVINKPKINWIELNWNRILTKNDVGLSNVDNTPDLEKPVSRLQQKAIDSLNASLNLRNKSAILPEATLENYQEVATEYIEEHYTREPISRDWLWLKMTDNKNVTWQVMYLKWANDEEWAWIYSWEITTPDLSNFYTKEEIDAQKESIENAHIKITWNYDIEWNKNFVWEVTKNSFPLINSSNIQRIEYVDVLPSTPNANTLYFVKS